MRTAIILSFLAMWLLAGCTSKPQPPPAAKAPDSKVMKFSDLPVPVRDVLTSAARTGGIRDNGLFVDPGQKWNSTDVIYDYSVPRRRLIFAGSIDGNWFVYYEHGGRGKHQHLVLLSLDGANKASILSNMYVPQPLTTIAEIRQAQEEKSIHPAFHPRHL